MIENSAIPLRTGEDSSRRRLVKAARSGNRSANCPVCAAPSLERCRKSCRHDGLQASFTRLLNRATQNGQLKFLRKICPSESHRRKPVDCSVSSYRGHEGSSAIPPAEAGGSFSPNLCFPLLDARAGIERSTGFRRWDSRAFLAPCRPGLNDPPAAAGGIPESQNLCTNFSWTVCLQLLCHAGSI